MKYLYLALVKTTSCFIILTMPTHDKENSTVHAMVVTTQRVIELMGRDLSMHFGRYKVSLVNMVPAGIFGSDAVTLLLAGKENDIKKSLSQLRKICFGKEIGVESEPIKSLPPVLKGYLSDMEDDIKFEKIFNYCSKEYLEFCKEHNIKPHPEVVGAV